MVRPIVTIGVPTFNRAHLLSRALTSVARQDYEKLEVIVADNASPGDETRRVVESFQCSIKRLQYVRHEHNIGAIPNFFYLLSVASGKYFMWLADDDEISPDYVSSLVDLLERHPDAASAAGNWVLMQSETRGRAMPTSSFPQPSPLRRALRFIWSTDDAFFYALHRTELLRKADFPGYWWPNRRVLLNWAYVYLLDQVLRGRVLLAESASVHFINHDYTVKDYARERPVLVSAFMHVCRRLNVHVLYWRKCARLLQPAALPLVILTSAVSLVREAAGTMARRVPLRRAGSV